MDNQKELKELFASNEYKELMQGVQVPKKDDNKRLY